MTTTVKDIWMKNFSHSLAYVEAKLDIAPNSKSKKDRDLHYFIKGTLYEMGRNLTTDLIVELSKKGLK